MITIIGILIALLLPAVQAAREAARQTQCRNNLKQIALGCLNHESATQRFPTGGWGWAWTGDADLGTAQHQPGGWIYNILPYIEQPVLHDLGTGLPQAQKYVLHAQRASTPLTVLYCPTRRPAISYPWNGWSSGHIIVNSAEVQSVGRSDYAANGGDYITTCGYPTSPLWPLFADSGSDAGPANLADGGVDGSPTQIATARQDFANVAQLATGIVYAGSLIALADVTDGTSNTYLVGEKYLDPDSYNTGTDAADNEQALMGDNPDVSRWSSWRYPIIDPVTDWLLPYPDTPGAAANYNGFGSAHANGFFMAFCDGSVQMMSYTIDPETHRRLCNRKDGQAIDGKSY